LLENKHIRGHIIIPFEFNQSKISFYPYIIEISENNEFRGDLKSIVNNFFNSNVLIVKKPHISDIGKGLLRIPLKKGKGSYTRDEEKLFKFQERKSINEIIKDVKYKLYKQNIIYRMINENTFMISNNMLIILDKLVQEKVIKLLKLLEVFHVYLIFINERDFEKILRYNHINELENLNILKISEFNNFDFRSLL
jgi:hypothetical protein